MRRASTQKTVLCSMVIWKGDSRGARVSPPPLGGGKKGGKEAKAGLRKKMGKEKKESMRIFLYIS